MCDALSWNTSKLKAPDAVVLAHCLAHGRRKFVDIEHNFPEQCLHILVELGKVSSRRCYADHFDHLAKIEKMKPPERLKYHKTHSKPVMDELRIWMKEQLESKAVEPNSSLGSAINYLEKRWKSMTLFLRDGKAPLDNNLCERAIKKTVLNRKNALFYRTLNGAQVGDLFMSFIHTCELNGVNPFEYLVALQKQEATVLKAEPEAWMPWNYKSVMPVTDLESEAR